jgi:murein DD-endopeptidase MepM/ murein hydrolase activator NlpD
MPTTSDTPRRAVRQSRPDSLRWLTVMVVLSHRTFRWSISKQRLLWIAASITGIWAFGVIGSGYGLWSFRRVMSFSQLQRETRDQQAQLKASLEQAQKLEEDLTTLRNQHLELMRLLDPKAPGPSLPPMPGQVPTSPANPTEVKAKLSQLKESLLLDEAQARAIKARMEPILKVWATTPSIAPTVGYLSSGYGVRVTPFANVKEEGEGLLSFHTGLDISNQAGTPIQATADGDVVQAGWMDRYGNGIVIRHNGELETLYGHLERIDVKVGQHVTRGDILGGMGRSGNATGVHLHYEVRRGGKPINPSPYLKLQKQWLSGLTPSS